MTFLSLTLCHASAVYADTFGSGSNIFDIEFVSIGNPGNTADPSDGDSSAPGIQNYGRVSYTYRIGEFEVSEEIIDKANAQSALDGNPISITKDTRGPARPATSINWLEATRFVNWLNTESGGFPAYKFDGSGIFQLWQPGDAGYDPNNLYRNSLATYFLPSADEWYKAAYYDPIAEVYSDFPTGSDSVPDGIDFLGDTTFDAVFADGGVNSQPNDIIDVGLLSPYGTAGQGGNVFEWEETNTTLVNNNPIGFRGIRGGSWNSVASTLSSSSRFPGGDISFEFTSFGFRVASVETIPEPTTLALAALALVGVGCFRRRHT